MSQPARHKPQPNDVVVVSAVRTPLCRATKGKLSKIPPSTLLSTVLTGCLQQPASEQSTTTKYLVSPTEVQDICVGNVLAPASGYAAWRMAQLSCGIPHTVPLSVVNRQCSSGLQAIANIAAAISRGDIQIGIGAGVESMSFHPMHKLTKPDVDWEVMKKGGHDAMDCLLPMGITSENVSARYGQQREALDTFAVASHAKAAQARMQGKFQEEIIPVGDVTQDDGIRPNTTLKILSKLKPVFNPNGGSTTAGNSSQLTDGAAAVLLMTRQEALKRKLEIMAVWRGFAVKGVPPRIMGIGPALAIPAVLKQAGLTMEDVSVLELNEAFASQAVWCLEHLGLAKENGEQTNGNTRVNPNGGAIALGHPLGCTGARMVATLLHEMNRKKGAGADKRGNYGVVSMCIGTGMGAAAVLEVEPIASSL